MAGIILPDPFERSLFPLSHVPENELDHVRYGWSNLFLTRHAPKGASRGSRLPLMMIRWLEDVAMDVQSRIHTGHNCQPLWVLAPSNYLGDLRPHPAIYLYTWDSQDDGSRFLAREHHVFFERVNEWYRRLDRGVLEGQGEGNEVAICKLKIAAISLEEWAKFQELENPLVRRRATICALFSQNLSLDDPRLHLAMLEDPVLKQLVDIYSMSLVFPS